MTVDDWAWVLVPPLAAAGLGYFIGKLITWFVSVAWLPWSLAGLGAVIGLPGSIWIHRLLLVGKALSRADVHQQTVETIDVIDPVVVTLQEINDEGPIYYFDVGDGKILLLWGQWLYDPHVFPKRLEAINSGEEPDVDDFPCSHFRVHRLPISGDVIRIDLIGEPIKPVLEVKRDEISLWGFGPSQVFNGTLANLKHAVDAARTAATSAEAQRWRE